MLLNFKNSMKGANKKVMGLYMPHYWIYYAKLVALSEKTTPVQVIESLLKDLKKNNEEVGITEQILQEKTARNLYEKYLTLPAYSWEKFCSRASKELLKKGLDEKNILLALKNIKAKENEKKD